MHTKATYHATRNKKETHKTNTQTHTMNQQSKMQQCTIQEAEMKQNKGNTQLQHNRTNMSENKQTERMNDKQSKYKQPN